VKRREFVTLLGGAAAAWPLAARAQQPGRMPLIAVLTGVSDDQTARTRSTAFVTRLQELGWTDGRNMRLELRWGRGDAEIIRRQATELVALAPDVIVTTGGPATERMLERTKAALAAAKRRGKRSELSPNADDGRELARHSEGPLQNQFDKSALQTPLLRRKRHKINCVR
jgi:ABC-type uncharacterized transport system substrate-binding protein